MGQSSTSLHSPSNEKEEIKTSTLCCQLWAYLYNQGEPEEGKKPHRAPSTHHSLNDVGHATNHEANCWNTLVGTEHLRGYFSPVDSGKLMLCLPCSASPYYTPPKQPADAVLPAQPSLGPRLPPSDSSARCIFVFNHSGMCFPKLKNKETHQEQSKASRPMSHLCD